MKRNSRNKGKVPRERQAHAPAGGKDHPKFPIVGVGASAGGLEVFSELLKPLPVDTGMAIVLVKHLDPKHGSGLSEILTRTTQIPIAEVTDGTVAEPNHIYVIPANTEMVIEKGVLKLGARERTAGRHLPIDHFFQSLAQDLGDRAIGVILSGTGSDGTAGCRAIRAGGGITFAQDEQSAKYSDMPRSAVSAGCIDFILPPKSIATELTRIDGHPHAVHPPLLTQEPVAMTDGDELSQIFSMLLDATGVDFAHYK